MNPKRILLVVAFVIFVIAMAFALYWVFFRGGSLPGGGDGNTNSGGSLPNIGAGNVTIISTSTPNIDQLPWDQIRDQISPVANGGLTAVNTITESSIKGLDNGSLGLRYYDEAAKKFYKINENGEPEVLSDKQFYNVENVNWSQKGDKAVLEYPDGNNILYNFETGEQVTLPAELEDFSFDRSGTSLAAEWIDASGNDENNWLVLVSENGANVDLIEPLGDEALDTQVGFSPDNQVAALYREYIDIQRQEVYPIGIHGENFSSFVVNGAGFTSEWSPEGNSLIYSVYNKDSDYLPTLYVTQGNTNSLGQIKASLNLNTWPDKCTFAGEGTMYCAVPRGLPRGAGLYPEIAADYTDTFYKVNVNTGVQQLIADPVGDSLGYNAHDLFVSGNNLYFTDQDGVLQMIQLQ